MVPVGFAQIHYNDVMMSAVASHITSLTIVYSCFLLCFFLLLNYNKLQWRHNEHSDVSNHRRLYCLLNRLFGLRSKKTSKLRVTGLCAGNSPVTGEFPAQMASNAKNVSIWWRHPFFSSCHVFNARVPTRKNIADEMTLLQDKSKQNHNHFHALQCTHSVCYFIQNLFRNLEKQYNEWW